MAAAKQLQAAASAFRSHLTEKAVFAKLDDNPFGVDIGFISRLGGALARIEKAVS